MSRARCLAGVVATAGVLAACGVRTEDNAHFVADDEVPFNLLEVATTQPPDVTVPPASTSTVALCFVDGERIVPVTRAAPPDLDPTEAVELLGQGPSRLEEGAGLATALPEDALSSPVENAGGIAEVDLSGSFADAGGRQQLRAIAQVVCTLTARPGIGQVAFTLDGEPIAVPRGDASTTTDPVTRDDYRRLITRPDGATDP
jgi:spore germination protein GerM